MWNLLPQPQRRELQPVLKWPIAHSVSSVRVYYEVEQEPEPVVRILAVGIKERNRVRIGKEVIDL
jgi:hypothetical protein